VVGAATKLASALPGASMLSAVPLKIASATPLTLRAESQPPCFHL
jgi:hypothetical protein